MNENVARSGFLEIAANGGDTIVERAAALGAQLSSGSADRDRSRKIAFDEFKTLVSTGILAARVPAEFGGPEVSFLDFAKAFVHLGAGDPNVAQAVLPHACLMEKVRIYGSKEQQRRISEEMLAGKLITNASAERTGKVVGEIQTHIARRGNGYVLNGRKYYCTGSAFADAFFVLALADTGGRALVILPRDRAGLTVVDDWDGMGQRTTASGTVSFDNVEFDESELILLKNFGVRPTHEGGLAQLLHSAIDAGIAQAAFDDALKYGRSGARPVSESGHVRAGDDPYVQHTIGHMAMLVHSAIGLVERAGSSLDRAVKVFFSGEDSAAIIGATSVDVAEAKMASEYASLEVSEMIFRIGGASATSSKLNFDRHWRNARTHTTHDPVAYKAKVVGDFYLNGRMPPINTKY